MKIKRLARPITWLLCLILGMSSCSVASAEAKDPMSSLFEEAAQSSMQFMQDLQQNTTTLSAPLILLPDFAVAGGTIIASWQEVTGADHYLLSLRDLDTVNGFLLREILLSQTNYLLPGLALGHRYQLLVRAVPPTNQTSLVASEWSTRIFSYGVPSPISPLRMPTFSYANSIIQSLPFTASWNSIQGAAYYLLSLQDTTAQKNLFENKVVMGTSSIIPSTLTPGHSFVLRLCAMPSSANPLSGASAWAQWFFTYPPTPMVLNAPLIFSPSKQEAYTSTHLTASWTAVSGATDYRVSLQDVTENQMLLNGVSTYGTSYLLPALTACHQYRLGVMACSSGSNGISTSRWSIVDFSVADAHQAEIIRCVIQPSTATVDTNVQFFLTARNAEKVQLVINQIPSDTYPLYANQATLMRTFTQAGTYSIQWRAYGNGQWGKLSDMQTLVITSSGSKLSEPTIVPIAMHQPNTTITVYWQAVANATNYSVCLYSPGNVERWNTTTPVTQVQIPSTALASVGVYRLEVSANAPNMRPSVASAPLEISDRPFTPWNGWVQAYTTTSYATASYQNTTGSIQHDDPVWVIGEEGDFYQVQTLTTSGKYIRCFVPKSMLGTKRWIR